MKLKLSRLREYLRSSLWFIPGVCVVGSLVLVAVLTSVDRRLEDADVGIFFSGGPESARAVLTAIAASMITFTGLVFTITIVVLQLASSQFSPRVLRTFLRDRVSQIALGTFVSTFSYALVLLREVRSANGGQDAFVPGVGISVAFVFVLVSLAMFVNYINHTAQAIRAVNIITSVAKETRSLIERRYPRDPETEAPPALLPTGEPSVVITWPDASGMLVGVDEEGSVGAAQRADCLFVLLPAVGDFVPTGAPVVEVYGDEPPDHLNARRFLTIGRERTMQQDVAFGFRQLVDIAERALSPGVNDPTTAVQVIDMLHDLLRLLATRPLPPGLRTDAEGRPRLVVPRARWEDYLSLTLDEIRYSGAGSIQIARRLRAMLSDLRTIALHERIASIEHHMELLDAVVERSFPELADRKSARQADAQGHGS